MSDTEIQELIKEKREDLEKRRAENSTSSTLLKVLENEIQELENSLNKSDSGSDQVEQAFLDECAG